MDPSLISFFMHQCVDDDDIKDFLSGLSLPDGDLRLFVPVNDSMSDSSWTSGSHWSLLVCNRSRSSTEFWHFDSVKNSGNQLASQAVAEKLNQHIFHSSSAACLSAVTPEQKNGYDCGLHMLQAVKLFCPKDGSNLKEHEAVLQSHIERNPDFCSELRREIATKIIRLKKGENREFSR